MGMGASLTQPGTLQYLREHRYLREFAKVERKHRRMRDRMWAVVRADASKFADTAEVFGRINAACDRVFPFPTYADVEHLPLPVWVDEPLHCQNCGTKGFTPGHIQGQTITQCSSCPNGWPLSDNGSKDGK